MPTIHPNVSTTVVLPTGCTLKTTGSGVAVLGPGERANQQIGLQGFSQIGPFSGPKAIYLTALTSLVYSFSGNLLAPPGGLDETSFDIISDSRSADAALGSGWNSRNWLVQARARYGQSFRINGLFGDSGKRSDQWLTNGNFELAMASTSRWLVVGYPVVNDISQAAAGYNDVFGNAITLANVAPVTVNSLIAHAQKAVAVGKEVIMLTEPGSTGFTAAQTAAVHEFNRLLKFAVRGCQGIRLYDPTPIIWSPTGSTTVITKKTGFTSDGTHAQQMEGGAVGSDFATNFLPTIIPRIDDGAASLSDTVANGTNQLFRNPLFNTLAGGTTGSNITLSSGTVPANCVISGSSGTTNLSVDITSAANSGGYGNSITLAINCTSAAAGDFRFDLQTTLADWQLTDEFEGCLGMDIASGSTMLGIYPALEVITDTSTKTNSLWDMYAGSSGPMSTAAVSGLSLRTKRGGAIAGSTSKTAVQLRIRASYAAGGGAATITLYRPRIDRYA